MLPLESVSCTVCGPYADRFGMMQIMPYDWGWISRTRGRGRPLGLAAMASLPKPVPYRGSVDRLAEFSPGTFVKIYGNLKNQTLSVAIRELAACSQTLLIGGH